MDNTETTGDQEQSPGGQSDVGGAAKSAGSASGKAQSAARANAQTAPKKPVKLKENAYQAQYLGSGTFNISKPKRSKTKRRQAALKNRRRGSRK
jgi:hypothetical protein